MVLRIGLMLAIGLLALACSPTPPVTADGSPDAARLYNIHCAACHKPDGSGGIAGAKNLMTTKLSKSDIEHVIKNGQGDMMPFSSILSPDETAAVANFVHDFKY